MSSPYGSDSSSSSGGSVYGSGPSSSSGGSVYSSGSSSRSSRAYSKAKKKKGHHGIGGFFENLGADAEAALTGSVPAAIRTGKAVVHDASHDPLGFIAAAGTGGPVGYALTHPHSQLNHEVVAPTVAQYKYQYGPAFHGDFGEVAHRAGQHPLAPLLDALSVISLGAGSVARVGAAGRAIAEGGDVAAVAKALASRPKIPARTFEHGGLTANGKYARNAAIRGGQKLLDKARRRFPDAPILGRPLPARVGFELNQDRRIRESLQRAPAQGLQAAGRKLTTPQQTALRVVAEGQPIDTRIAFHRHQIAIGANKTAHAKDITVLEAARKYIVDEAGKPVFRPGPVGDRLKAVYEQTAAVAKNREDILGRVGRLSGDTAEGRVHAPGQVIQDNLAGKKYGGTAAKANLERGGQTQLNLLSTADVEDEHFFNQFGDYFNKDVNSHNGTTIHNVHDEHGNIVGSMVYDAAPGRKSVYVESVFMRPEFRGDISYFKRLVEPLVKDGRPISAEFQNDRLRAAFERATGRGTVSGSALKRSGDASIPKGFAPDNLPPLRVGPRPFAAGDFRVPYTARGPLKSLAGHAKVGSNGIIGVPKEIGTTTHAFEGKLLQGGRFRHDVTHLVAESNIEAQRFAALLHARDQFISAATDTRMSKYDIPIRLDKNALIPDEVRNLIGKYQEGATFSKDETQALGATFEAVRQHLFPDEATVGPHDGIKWIDRRLLGGLDKKNPMIGWWEHASLRRSLKVTDAVNNASRLALLYLKPAYAVPNLLTNAAMTVLNQGFLAVPNLARAATLNAKLGVREAATVDVAMGEGFALSVAGEQGALHGLVAPLSRLWNVAVDLPFRRAAFLHAARQAGFSDLASVRRLLTDKTLEPRLVAVAREANAAIIDYARMGPVEKGVVKRVLFFYPWVKGSTVYTGRLVADHPVALGLSRASGAAEQQRAQQELGDVPSYLPGLFKVGGTQDTPVTMNPGAVAISSPVDIYNTVAEGLIGGSPVKAARALNFATPSASVLISIITGRDAFSDKPYTGSPVVGAGKSLYQGVPIYTLIHRITHDQSGKTFPLTDRDALLQFLVGTLAPRPTNRAKLNTAAYNEQQPRR